MTNRKLNNETLKDSLRTVFLNVQKYIFKEYIKYGRKFYS